jgi:hypothetical protein
VFEGCLEVGVVQEVKEFGPELNVEGLRDSSYIVVLER